MILNLTFVDDFLILKLLHEVVDFFLLLIQDLILLGIIFITLLLLQILFNLLDALLISLNHLPDVSHILLSLLDFSVVLFDSVQQSFSRLGEGQIHLVCLQLQVVLLLRQLCFFFFQVLCSLFQGVSLQSTFSLYEMRIDLLQFVSALIDILLQPNVFLFQLFILIPLFRI